MALFGAVTYVVHYLPKKLRTRLLNRCIGLGLSPAQPGKKRQNATFALFFAWHRNRHCLLFFAARERKVPQVRRFHIRHRALRRMYQVRIALTLIIDECLDAGALQPLLIVAEVAG